jgi:hypothetical protein
MATKRKTTKRKTSTKKRANSRGRISKQAGFLRRPRNFSSRQLLVFIVIFGALGGLILWKGFALRSYAAVWADERSRDLQAPVEQQTGSNWASIPQDQWVINPTSCAWDVDDLIYRVANGSLGPNQAITDTQCVIADGHVNWTGGSHGMAFVTTANAKDGQLYLRLTQITTGYRTTDCV